MHLHLLADELGLALCVILPFDCLEALKCRIVNAEVDERPWLDVRVVAAGSL